MNKGILISCDMLITNQIQAQQFIKFIEDGSFKFDIPKMEVYKKK